MVAILTETKEGRQELNKFLNKPATGGLFDTVLRSQAAKQGITGGPTPTPTQGTGRRRGRQASGLPIRRLGSGDRGGVARKQLLGA